MALQGPRSSKRPDASGPKTVKDLPKSERGECVTVSKTLENAAEKVAISSISTGVMQQQEESERTGPRSSATMPGEENINSESQRRLKRCVVIFRWDDAVRRMSADTPTRSKLTPDNNKPRIRDRQTMIAPLEEHAQQCGIPAFAKMRTVENIMVETTERQSCATTSKGGSIAASFLVTAAADFRMHANRKTQTTFHWGTASLKRSCLAREVPSLKTNRGTSVLGLANTRGPNTTALFMNPLWWPRVVIYLWRKTALARATRNPQT